MMKRKYFGMLTVLCGLLLSALPAVAHHSIGSEYDFQKPIEITGILTRVDFVNPHSIFTVEVTNADNTKATWVFQAGGAGYIRRQLDFPSVRDMVNKPITVYGFASNVVGKKGGFIKAIKLPDGKTFTMWFGDPNG
jgi:hypothetical protein